MTARCAVCVDWIKATDACAYVCGLINHRDTVHLRFHVHPCTAFSSDDPADWCEHIFSRLCVQSFVEEFARLRALKNNDLSAKRAHLSLPLRR